MFKRSVLRSQSEEYFFDVYVTGQLESLEQMILGGQEHKWLKLLEPPAGVEPATY